MELQDFRKKFQNHVPGLQSGNGRYAVLVPLVQQPEGLCLLYEVRASQLRTHASEVCFPGGRMEPGETPTVCALRETRRRIESSKKEALVLKHQCLFENWKQNRRKSQQLTLQKRFFHPHVCRPLRKFFTLYQFFLQNARPFLQSSLSPKNASLRRIVQTCVSPIPNASFALLTSCPKGCVLLFISKTTTPVSPFSWAIISP